VIIVTSTAKDAVGYAGKCAASVRSEPTPHEHWFTVVDDETAEEAGGEGATVIRSSACCLTNLLYMWRRADPSDIIVHLDGDDQLTPGALGRVAHMYERDDVWLTYGSFVRDDGVPDWIWHSHFGRRYVAPPRIDPWRASHLRTFRAGLMQKIPESYLVRPSGEPYTSCLDLVVMYCLLEMAGERYRRELHL
jgi:glycosyltransferase involved in cell wall biosynthesis